ncbi:MAG: hypothetical protein IT331_05135 [Anaerolineae bacterium]|nr:hypothetical protein [Anaerolineae bacterium]
MKTPDPRTQTVSLVLIISGVVLALISFIAIIGVWSISSVLINSALPLLNRAEQAVTRLDDATQSLDNRLAAAQERIQAIEDRVTATGLTLEEANLLRIALDRLIGDELMPILKQVGDIINTVVQIADGIEDTMAAVNSIPFVNIEVPGAQQYHELRGQINNLISTVQDLRSDLQNRKVETVQELVSLVTGYTTRAQDMIASVRAPISATQTQTAELRASLAQANATLPVRITWSAIGLSLVFFWMLLSQLVLIGVGWALRKGTPFLGFRMVGSNG